MCEEGGCVRLGQEGFVWVGGTVWNTLKGGGTKKRGRETKIFKKGRNLGEGVGTLKWGVGECWNPFPTVSSGYQHSIANMN